MAKKPAVVEEPVDPATAYAAMTLGQLIDKMQDNRDQRRPLEAAMKPLEEDYKLLKMVIIDKLAKEGVEKNGTARATVSISRVTVPVIDDTETLVKYLVRTKNLHVFLGQPMSTPSWRELVERKGGDLPGTHTFTKIDLNHTSIKK